MHVKRVICVSRSERPAIRYFPVRRDLESVRLAVHQVLVREGEDHMGRSRGGFGKWRARFRGLKIVVIVEIRGKINGKTVAHSRSIAQLISKQAFVLVLQIAV